ncbi:hypothetical protein HPB51_003625 [Rhipicephalus microplus]|uniref:Uncharacterized protein n=1 Tax=Rhipicephalus microplus TaxID=6941 RepID=A0A9J6DY79_RHIMP|nr:hypothetical protein HPB51_003625 [Rhipicephalus microplus]
MDVPTSQEYIYQSRPRTIVTREQRPDGTSQVTHTTTRLVSTVSTGSQLRPEFDGGNQSWQLSESFRSLTSPDGIQAYTANLEPQRGAGQTTVVHTIGGVWSSEHDSPQWESRQSQPTEGHTRFGTSWVVTRHDRSPSPMPFLAAAHPANDTSDTQPQPQVVTTSTREPTLSNLQGEPRIVSDTSVDDELRALSSLAGRQELAPGEVKLVESDFKREVEPLNLVSSRVVQDTEERKTIELKFQEKVQLVHYSFQLPSFAEFVEVPEEDLEKVRPLDSMGVGGVAANATPGEKQTVTERYSVRLQGSEVNTGKLLQGHSGPETVSNVVSTRYSQDSMPSSFADGGTNVLSQPPTGFEEPKTTTKQEPSYHTPQQQQGAAGKVPAETGKGVTSTLVFPVDAKIETAQSETQRNVVSRTTVTVRQLSPGEGSTAADPTRSFLSPKPTEKTGKEDQNEEPMLVAPEPGTAEVDAAIAKSRISKSPPRGIAESTTDVGTAVRSATKELLSGAPQQPTDVKAFEKQEKETAEGHPKHLELQKKVSPYPSVIVTKTLPGQQDVDSGKPTPLSETDEKPVVKPLLSQPQPDNSSPLLASETRKLTDPESGERKATGDDVSANSSDPKQLKKSSKKKKKDHSPSPAPQVQDTKSSSNPLDRFGKKVKKFAMNLFSGDSKHPSEVIPTDNAKKEQPVQSDGETKKEKKKKSKKKSKAPLPEELTPVMPTRAETDSDKRDSMQPVLLTETDRVQTNLEGSNTTLATTEDITPAGVSRELVMPHVDGTQPHSVPTSLVRDAKTPRVMPGSAQVTHGVTPGIQSDKPHGVKNNATSYTVDDPVTAATFKSDASEMTQQSPDDSSAVPSYVPVYSQPSIGGKASTPQKVTQDFPHQSADTINAEHGVLSDKPETGKLTVPSEESTLTIIYGVPTITTTTIVSPLQTDSLSKNTETLQQKDSKQQPNVNNKTGIHASSYLQKSSHQDIIGVADTKTAISDGSKPQLQEDKKHKGKKKKGQKEQAIGHDDQPQYDRQQDGSKSDKPKVSTDEQSQNQYSQVLVTEEMSVIRSREYTPHTNEKTPKLNEATTRVHQEVPQARGKVTDTSDFKKPDQNEEQPHLVDKLKEETTELKSRSTQPMGQHDDDEKNLISELADIIRECRKDCPEPDIGSSPRKHPTSALIGLKEIPDKSDAHDLHPGKETKGKPKKPLNEEELHEEVVPSSVIEPSDTRSGGTQEMHTRQETEKRQRQGWFSSLVAAAKSITSWDSTDEQAKPVAPVSTDKQAEPAAPILLDSEGSAVLVSPHTNIRSGDSKPRGNDEHDTAPQPVVEFERAVPSAPFELDTSFDDRLHPGAGASSPPSVIEGLESIIGNVPSASGGGDSRIISERYHSCDVSSEQDDNTSVYSTGTDDSFSVLHSHRPHDEPKVPKGRQKKHKQKQKGETFLVASAVSSHAGRRSLSKSPSPPSERDKPSAFRESRSPPPPGFLPEVLGQVLAPRWVTEGDHQDVTDYTAQAPVPQRSAQPSSEKVDEFVKADATTFYTAPPGQQSSMSQKLHSWLPSFGAASQKEDAPLVQGHFERYSEDTQWIPVEFVQSDGGEKSTETVLRSSPGTVEGRPVKSPTSSGVDSEEPLPDWIVDTKWPSQVTTVIILVFRRIFIIEKLLKEASSFRGNERQQKIQEAQRLIDDVSRQLYDPDVCQSLEKYHSEHPEMARRYGELSDQLQRLAEQLDSTKSSAAQPESPKPVMDERSMQFWLGLESLHVWLIDLQRLLGVHLDALSNPVVLRDLLQELRRLVPETASRESQLADLEAQSRLLSPETNRDALERFALLQSELGNVYNLLEERARAIEDRLQAVEQDRKEEEELLASGSEEALPRRQFVQELNQSLQDHECAVLKLLRSPESVPQQETDGTPTTEQVLQEVHRASQPSVDTATPSSWLDEAPSESSPESLRDTWAQIASSLQELEDDADIEPRRFRIIYLRIIQLIIVYRRQAKSVLSGPADNQESVQALDSRLPEVMRIVRRLPVLVSSRGSRLSPEEQAALSQVGNELVTYIESSEPELRNMISVRLALQQDVRKLQEQVSRLLQKVDQELAPQLDRIREGDPNWIRKVEAWIEALCAARAEVRELTRATMVPSTPEDKDVASRTPAVASLAQCSRRLHILWCQCQLLVQKALRQQALQNRLAGCKAASKAQETFLEPLIAPWSPTGSPQQVKDIEDSVKEALQEVQFLDALGKHLSSQSDQSAEAPVEGSSTDTLAEARLAQLRSSAAALKELEDAAREQLAWMQQHPLWEPSGPTSLESLEEALRSLEDLECKARMRVPYIRDLEDLSRKVVLGPHVPPEQQPARLLLDWRQYWILLSRRTTWLRREVARLRRNRELLDRANAAITAAERLLKDKEPQARQPSKTVELARHLHEAERDLKIAAEKPSGDVVSLESLEADTRKLSHRLGKLHENLQKARASWSTMTNQEDTEKAAEELLSAAEQAVHHVPTADLPMLQACKEEMEACKPALLSALSSCPPADEEARRRLYVILRRWQIIIVVLLKQLRVARRSIGEQDRAIMTRCALRPSIEAMQAALQQVAREKPTERRHIRSCLYIIQWIREMLKSQRATLDSLERKGQDVAALRKQHDVAEKEAGKLSQSLESAFREVGTYEKSLDAVESFLTQAEDCLQRYLNCCPELYASYLPALEASALNFRSLFKALGQTLEKQERPLLGSLEAAQAELTDGHGRKPEKTTRERVRQLRDRQVWHQLKDKTSQLHKDMLQLHSLWLRWLTAEEKLINLALKAAHEEDSGGGTELSYAQAAARADVRSALRDLTSADVSSQLLDASPLKARINALQASAAALVEPRLAPHRHCDWSALGFAAHPAKLEQELKQLEKVRCNFLRTEAFGKYSKNIIRFE